LQFNFIAVYGENANGRKLRALILHTEIQIAITVLNTPPEKQPIGSIPAGLFG
jgi:hypothetical protein